MYRSHAAFERSLMHVTISSWSSRQSGKNNVRWTTCSGHSLVLKLRRYLPDVSTGSFCRHVCLPIVDHDAFHPPVVHLQQIHIDRRDPSNAVGHAWTGALSGLRYHWNSRTAQSRTTQIDHGYHGSHTSQFEKIGSTSTTGGRLTMASFTLIMQGIALLNYGAANRFQFEAQLRFILRMNN